MHTYEVYIQYQSISCKHRHGMTAFIRAKNEEDAIAFARTLPCDDSYEIRRVSIIKEIEIYEVEY